MKLEPLRPGVRIDLTDDAAAPPHGAPDGDTLKKANRREEKQIGKLQQVLYADRRFALLIVLQGRDAAGKDGTVKHVFSAVNPQGCAVTSFGVPSVDEERHDFLWRIHARVPSRGMIGIFNRSHYEDVIVPRVHGALTQSVIDRRYAQINDFERMLAENGTTILKFFLHVSRDEQKSRLEKRLSNPEKNWKFRAGDLDDRGRWDDYTEAYRLALRRCSTKWAPWYVVPADHKKTRNYLISRVIAKTLKGMKLEYPKAAADVLSLKVR